MDIGDPTLLATIDLLAALQSGRLTSATVVEAYLSRIAQRDDDVAAWAYLNADAVIEQARAADRQRIAGGALPALLGLPIAIKDIIDTVDQPTELGCEVFAGRQPEKDASVVAQLRAHGAIIFGKTVTTELAFFGPGKTINPHHPDHTPGGSSSGSAAATADRQIPLALGTQTAGSIIRPASYCGSIGFKPTFGYVSRTGILEQSRPLDTIGGYARDVAGIALLLDAISAHDPLDVDMRPGRKPSLLAGIAEPMTRPPRLAFVKTSSWNLADVDARAALEKFAGGFGARAEVVETALPAEFDDAFRLQQIVQFCDIARNYGPIADDNPTLVSDKLREVIATGRQFSASDYSSARAACDPLYDQLRPILVNYDAILTPAAAGPAHAGLQSTGSPVFNAVWTYLGMPAISLPLLRVRGMPLGVQLVGARGNDCGLLQLSDWMMQSLPAA